MLAGRLPEMNDSGPFYLTAISKPKSQVWFSRQRMGEHKIGQLMKGMAVKSGLRYQPPFRTVFARIAPAFVVFMKDPINYTFFGSLIIPENDLLFKKKQKFSAFGKCEGFSTRSCLHRLGSTPSRNKETKTINTAVSSWHLWLKNRVSDFWQVRLFFFY